MSAYSEVLVDRRSWSLAAMAAVVVLVSGCTGAAESTAEATPTPEVIHAPTPAASEVATPRVEPTPTPTPTSTVEPTVAPDPMVVPDDPEDIDVAYMQAVVDVFAQNEGDIVREAVEQGQLTDRLIELMNQAYGGELRDRSILGYRDDFIADPSLPEFKDSPGDPVWTVTRAYVDGTTCVGVRIDRDISATASAPDRKAEPLFLVLSSRPADETAWMPWRLDRMFAVEGGQLEENPCDV